MKKFINGSGKIIETNSKEEIKKYKMCGWKEIKSTKTVFAKGLINGNNFYK